MPEPETTPPRTRVEVDLNVRANGGQARVGFEDADGPLQPGQVVEVFESESGLTGVGTVTAINTSTRIAWIAVEWPQLAERPACTWPSCLTPEQQAQLAEQVTAAERGETTMPMPDQRQVCGCTETADGGADAYEKAITAPMSPATVEALRVRLESGDVPRRKVRRHQLAPAEPVPGLRDQIAGVFRAVDGEFPAWTKRDAGPEAHVDAVMAVVQPYLDRLAADQERYEDDVVGRFNQQATVDRRRAETAEAALAKVRGIEPDKLDLLADWFDTDDARKGPGRNFAVQADLRQWARTLRALTPPVPADQPEGGVG